MGINTHRTFPAIRLTGGGSVGCDGEALTRADEQPDQTERQQLTRDPAGASKLTRRVRIAINTARAYLSPIQTVCVWMGWMFWRI